MKVFGGGFGGALGRVAACAVLGLTAGVIAQSRDAPRHSQEVVAEGILVQYAQLMRKKPDLHWPKAARFWVVERTSEVGALLVEVVGTVPMHLHPDGNHRMYIIEGEMQILVGSKEVVMKPGDYASIPRGVRHKFQVRPGHKKAVFATVDPPLDPKKTIWLEPAPAAAPAN